MSDDALAPRWAAARALLQRHFGYDAFRPAQARVVRSVLLGRDTLGVLPTGAGKSVCFQVPAHVLGGLTVVVSPLVSLMDDQVAAARERGLSAGALHASLPPDEAARVRAALDAGTLRLLYLSPERAGVLAPALAERGIRAALLAIDEAHCVSEWGHDFRPSYRALGRVRRLLGDPPTVALTGSATPAVRADIAAVLRLGRGAAPDVHVGSFDRRNLWFGVVRVRNAAERRATLLELLRADDCTAIVYAPTRNVTEALARLLLHAGHRTRPYHAGLTAAERRRTLDAFLADEVDVVVATCAFGMGIDKPTVRLVVHWTMPPTPEAYYQEAGRAGRDGRPARCILLAGRGDGTLHRRQLDVTFPPERLLTRLWRGEARPNEATRGVVLAAERLRRELRPERGRVDWGPVRSRRAAAEARIRAVERYAEGRGCRRATLVGYFGEQLDACAGCDRCAPSAALPPLPPEVRERVRRLCAAVPALPAPTLVRLACRPPADLAELAAVPGVGPVLAGRVGTAVFAALGVVPATASMPGPLEARLREWRAEVAHAAGVPAHTVLDDAILAPLAAARPADVRALARLGLLGPRTLARFGETLVALLAAPAEPGEGPARDGAGIYSGLPES